jgi:hypothetical protein
MMRRRRPLARAAMVGGAAYYAGSKVQQGRQQDAETQARIEDLEAQQYQQAPAPAAPAAPGAVTPEALAQLEQLSKLKDQGVLTQDEFDVQKRRLLGTA